MEARLTALEARTAALEPWAAPLRTTCLKTVIWKGKGYFKVSIEELMRDCPNYLEQSLNRAPAAANFVVSLDGRAESEHPSEYGWWPVTVPLADIIELVRAQLGDECKSERRYFWTKAAVLVEKKWLTEHLQTATGPPAAEGAPTGE